MFSRAIWSIEILGFRAKLDPGWLLVAALMVWSLLSGFFPDRLPDLHRGDYFLLSVIATLVLFGSIILHELAHAAAARRLQPGARDKPLHHFAGMSATGEDPQDPLSEVSIALAGLMVPTLVAAAAYAVRTLIAPSGAMAPYLAVLEYAALINFALAVFNLIPAFPLDGGRVLRAVLWQITGSLPGATRAAVRVSVLCALALIAIGFVSLFSGASVAGAWQILIGIFLLLAARGAQQQLAIRNALRDKTVSALMTRKLHAAAPEDTLSETVDRIILRHSRSFLPVTEGEHLLGYVDTALISSIDQENWDDTHVADIYVGSNDANTIPPNLAMTTLMRRMTMDGRRKFLVAEQGRLLGVITLADLSVYIAVLQELELSDDGGRALTERYCGK
ncbi:site-2 protease family protein [Defluviimonas sp. WL0002]|uniref:Zinc metalloprotease n=1 Tax=Albidovulum marisflavi TaxID=2984159 RepID=A0ABT2ZB91_9RHOB|nr:site-2 protease family protein [Defluviimonas sp. WL0002]MCV2868400.1 site-2 protease family protein [Defluviimonas sp. WL0002]